MASIEKAIRDYLLTKTAVTDLIGTGTSARIQPSIIDQDWRPVQGPFVVYDVISSDEEHTLADRTGFVSSRFQFTVYAQHAITALSTARAIKNCGIAAIKGTYSSVSIRGVEIESGIRTDFEKPDDGLATFRHLATFDMMVHYLEG